MYSCIENSVTETPVKPIPLFYESGGGAASSVLAICLSERKGHSKKRILQGELRERHGLVGDAHAGAWHRQLSLLAYNDIESMRAQGFPGLRFGAFAENLVIGGLDFEPLGIGSRLRIGASAVIRITQIGKECHTMCAIRVKVGDCIMPRRGLFAVVEQDGLIAEGDSIEVIEAVPRDASIPVGSTTAEAMLI